MCRWSGISSSSSLLTHIPISRYLNRFLDLSLNILYFILCIPSVLAPQNLEIRRLVSGPKYPPPPPTHPYTDFKVS
jgi:hypothetical protein